VYVIGSRAAVSQFYPQYHGRIILDSAGKMAERQIPGVAKHGKINFTTELHMLDAGHILRYH